MEQVDAEIWEIKRLAVWAENGFLPVSGGVMDQTVSFLDATEEIKNEEAKIKLAALKK